MAKTWTETPSEIVARVRAADGRAAAEWRAEVEHRMHARRAHRWGVCDHCGASGDRSPARNPAFLICSSCYDDLEGIIR